jgi:heptosyltransferase-1
MTIAEVTWLMTRANLVAGVDTGLLHLAAAYGVPLVGVFTGTDPRVYFPDWLVRAEAVGGAGKPPSPDEVRSVIDRIGRWH